MPSIASLLRVTRDRWDTVAASFDDAPDHGLRDPAVRAAWRDLVLGVLPAAPARIADLGCGTGSLAELLVDSGYVVEGVDLCAEMLRIARAKVPDARFTLGDAADPPLAKAAYNVVLCRHLFWTLPDPASSFARWLSLLRPGGIAILIEGHWSTGAGLAAAQTLRLVATAGRDVEIRPIVETIYWGKAISDERYLLISRPETGVQRRLRRPSAKRQASGS